MNKITINVPPEIRYISEWKEFELPNHPCIVDKQITGCGFTEWAITNKYNTIIASPRLILLENKEEQHKGEVFYARNDLDTILNVDRDLNKSLSSVKKSDDEFLDLVSDVDINKKKSELRSQIKKYFIRCLDEDRPCKILVTYDSYRIVYESIMEIGKVCFDSFHTIVDEFQSIFTDSRFKSSTELEFMNVLKNVQRLCFVSATPMMDEYLDMLPEFRNLPYYELDWVVLNPSRVISSQLEVHPCQKIIDIAVKIIQSYLIGDFDKAVIRDVSGNLVTVESRELVIYVNSVKNICDIIKKAGLTIENTNVLCSLTNENKIKIRKAFGLSRGQVGGIGKVPLRDEPRKMFTLCTRTVYLGADFYSDNARTLILSDANIECLAVDISLDLPQIMGRQRLECNPWKNRAEVYVKCISNNNKKSAKEYREYQLGKIEKTNNLLSAYNTAETSSIKHDLAEKYRKGARSENYRDDYVAVNVHNGKDLVPVFNMVAMVSEKRAFDIQQLDYSDRVRVLNQIINEGFCLDPVIEEVNDFKIGFRSLRHFTEKMKFLCSANLSKKALDIVLNQVVQVDYSMYYLVLGPEKIKSLSYQKSKLEKEYNRVSTGENINLKDQLYNVFPIGRRLSLLDAKLDLKDIYNVLNLVKSPKASDLEDYFEVKKTKVKNSEGKFVDGYEILKKKDQN